MPSHRNADLTPVSLTLDTPTANSEWGLAFKGRYLTNGQTPPNPSPSPPCGGKGENGSGSPSLFMGEGFGMGGEVVNTLRFAALLAILIGLFLVVMGFTPDSLPFPQS